MRWLSLLVLACSLSLSLSAQTLKYDLALKHWGEFYFPGQDWRWFRAQAIAESGLNPSAHSPVGAIGIMQLMPETARELGVDPQDPESNIRGGIKYDRQLWTGWKQAPNPQEQRNLTFSSYNAGPGNILKAVHLAQGLPEWTTAQLFLPRITGPHSAETINYVLRINRLMGAS